MGIFTFLMIIIMIICVLLVIVVMAQNPKGGGLSGTFGGTSSAQFGVQRTNDFMEKATWVLGGTIVALCLLSVLLTAKPSQVSAPRKAPATTTAPAKTDAPANTTTTTTVPAQQTAPATGR